MISIKDRVALMVKLAEEDGMRVLPCHHIAARKMLGEAEPWADGEISLGTSKAQRNRQATQSKSQAQPEKPPAKSKRGRR